MFAVYDFIETYLHVDPLCFWNDAAVPKSDVLAWNDVCIEKDVPEFKFRGWFLNDEDFLTGWKESGAERNFNYTYYKHVPSVEVIDRVAEAIVRSRFNMVVPASYIWIGNPAEESIVSSCARRGLFVSMHHQEPLGVSGRFFEQYWKDLGADVPYSYVSSREQMEKIWRQSVDGWKKYPDVIWNISLRGVGDRALWQTDKNAPKTMEERGALISKAMTRQLSILDEAGVPQKDRKYSTTLWLEGAVLNSKGVLNFPEGTTVIFSDNGPGWRWSRDFYKTKREKHLKYGVYYHAAVFYDGPHLCSLIPSVHMYGMLKEARDSGANESVLINVANVREYTYNIAAASRMLWDIDSFDAQTWQKEWVSSHLSTNSDKWESVFNVYYNSLELHPVSSLPMFLDGYLFFSCVELLKNIQTGIEKGFAPNREPFKLCPPDCAPDSTRFARRGGPVFSSPMYQYSRLCAQKASYEMARAIASKQYALLPEAEKPFAYTTIVYPSNLMYNLTSLCAELSKALQLYKDGNCPAASMCISSARKYYDAIIAARSEYSSGKWENWFRYNRMDFARIESGLTKVENTINNR